MKLPFSETTAARLMNAAARKDVSPEELLRRLLDQHESSIEADDAFADIAEGLAELDSGKGRPFEEYVVEQRAKWAARSRHSSC